MVAKLFYDDDLLAAIITNHSMSIEDVLEQKGIDMDKYAEDHGWDSWDYESLHLEFDD
jgi:hypothetical protein